MSKRERVDLPLSGLKGEFVKAKRVREQVELAASHGVKSCASCGSASFAVLHAIGVITACSSMPVTLRHLPTKLLLDRCP
jgi:hypothetical protein